MASVHETITMFCSFPFIPNDQHAIYGNRKT